MYRVNTYILCLAPHDTLTNPFLHCHYAAYASSSSPIALLIYRVVQMRKWGNEISILIYLSPAHVRMFTPLNRLQFIVVQCVWRSHLPTLFLAFASSIASSFPLFFFDVVFTLYRYKRYLPHVSIIVCARLEKIYTAKQTHRTIITIL